MMCCKFSDRTFDVPKLQHVYCGDPTKAGLLAAFKKPQSRGTKAARQPSAILVEIHIGIKNP
jgi:hypothetical protein